MDPSATGKTIGNYRISEQIGDGAMGFVWRGMDEALGRPVAIKMLRPELAGRPGLAERFRAEARTLGRLHHPNVAMVYALVEQDADLFLVMEFVEGETLSARLRRQGPLDMAPCFQLFHQALEGIHHAHQAGVVHRDVKPSNLMVDAAGRLKVVDFGIAQVRGRERMTRAGLLVGTPEYMSPEQVRGEEATIRSDVYSLGVVLYRMLTGTTPFEGDGEFDVLRAQVEQDPPRPRQQGVELPAALEDALLRSLEKSPARRFPDALAFREALVAAGAPAPVRWSRSGEPESPPTAEPPAESIAETAPELPTGPTAIDQHQTLPFVPGELGSTVPFDEPGAEVRLSLPALQGLEDGTGTRTLEVPVLHAASVSTQPGRRPFRPWIPGALLAIALGFAIVNWVQRSVAPRPEPAPAALPGAIAPSGITVPEAAVSLDAKATHLEDPAREPDPQPLPPEEAAGATPSESTPAAEPPNASGWEIRR